MIRRPPSSPLFPYTTLFRSAGQTSRLRTDHNPVFDLGDAGRRPGDALGFLALDPGANGAFQYHLAAVRFDGDPIGVQLGISLEGFHDLALKLRGLDLGLHSDDVGHTLYALLFSHGVLSGGLLILPLRRAFQGYPVVLDDDLDSVIGSRQFGLQGGNHIPRNIRIGTLINRRQPNLEIVRGSSSVVIWGLG